MYIVKDKNNILNKKYLSQSSSKKKYIKINFQKKMKKKS